VAGRIRDEDIDLVRERSPIADVIGEHLQLRNAGGGSLKGLCPFHEEKTPSFNVTPARGLYFCFSCQEGGDVISFVQKIENLTFADAVERLAARAGIELRYEQGGQVPGREQGQRRRLLDAHRAAAEFFSERLRAPDAAPARAFLAERGFDLADAQRFGAGYAPAEWEALTSYLLRKGFTQQELLLGGLASEGRRGPVDRFRGRLVWPIRDVTAEVIAFGARKLATGGDGPKYLNTPESPIFKKSSVLYGADLAKREIVQRRQVVIVEGYTDVMACHLAGVPTAVATCGTSFGEGHIKIVRRLLVDADRFQGEVIFTFDGDAAGQRAALRAFGLEEKFVTQTFVAVQPDGLDPCDLRLKHGDAAVRDLLASRVPLFEFAVRSVLRQHDLDTTEGQLAALDDAATIVARIKDVGLRKRYAVNLDRWLGLMDEQFVLERVAQHAGNQGGQQGAAGNGGRRGQAAARRRTGAPLGESGQPGDAAAGRDASRRQPFGTSTGPGDGRDRANGQQLSAGRPAAEHAVAYDPGDPVANVERQALKLAVQRPALCGPVFDSLGADSFTVPVHTAMFELIAGCGGAAGARGGQEWAARLRDAAPGAAARGFVTGLAVEPLEAPRADGEPDARYADGVLARVGELAVSRQIAGVKSRLQRMNPVEEQAAYNRLFGDLVALEQRRKVLLARADGAL
jgi:DNA primase